MKKIILIAVVVVVAIFAVKKCHNSGTEINGYEGVVASVEGSALNLTSGIKVQLLGVETDRTDVEMFLRSLYLDKEVVLYADSQSPKQTIDSPNETISAYVVVKGENGPCINRIAVNEYPSCYRPEETFDSIDWIAVTPDPDLIPKKNLALYMKQRTFLIARADGGIGTGFFINEDGLAVTNWHVLAPDQEKSSIAVLFQDNPDDSEVYSDKKRNFKNIRWSSDISGLDVTLVTVELENNEKVPYFNIAKHRPNQGDRIATFGNPHGLTASYSSGEISAFRTDKRDVDLVQYTMPTNGGNSGGPVCDIYGQIVAVHELGDTTAQNINYGIDAMQLRAVLDKLGLKYGGR